MIPSRAIGLLVILWLGVGCVYDLRRPRSEAAVAPGLEAGDGRPAPIEAGDGRPIDRPRLPSGDKTPPVDKPPKPDVPSLPLVTWIGGGASLAPCLLPSFIVGGGGRCSGGSTAKLSALYPVSGGNAFSASCAIGAVSTYGACSGALDGVTAPGMTSCSQLVGGGCFCQLGRKLISSRPKLGTPGEWECLCKDDIDAGGPIGGGTAFTICASPTKAIIGVPQQKAGCGTDQLVGGGCDCSATGGAIVESGPDQLINPSQWICSCATENVVPGIPYVICGVPK